MIESDGVIQMLEKRVETISDDGQKKIIEDFQKLHENEERIELQLELEETQRQMKEVQKEKEKAEKKVEEKDQEIKQMIQVMLANGMSLELISKSLSKSEDEIMELLKQSFSRIKTNDVFKYKMKLIIESSIIWRLFWCIIENRN